MSDVGGKMPQPRWERRSPASDDRRVAPRAGHRMTSARRASTDGTIAQLQKSKSNQKWVEKPLDQEIPTSIDHTSLIGKSRTPPEELRWTPCLTYGQSSKAPDRA